MCLNLPSVDAEYIQDQQLSLVIQLKTLDTIFPNFIFAWDRT